jgi:hypothetical protein
MSSSLTSRIVVLKSSPQLTSRRFLHTRITREQSDSALKAVLRPFAQGAPLVSKRQVLSPRVTPHYENALVPLGVGHIPWLQ